MYICNMYVCMYMYVCLYVCRYVCCVYVCMCISTYIKLNSDSRIVISLQEGKTSSVEGRRMLFVLHRVYYNLLCTMACLCKTRTFSYQNDDFSREEESLFTSITSPAFLLLPTHFPRPYPIFFSSAASSLYFYVNFFKL